MNENIEKNSYLLNIFLNFIYFVFILQDDVDDSSICAKIVTVETIIIGGCEIDCL